MFFANEPIILEIDNIVVDAMAIVEVGVRVGTGGGEFTFQVEASLPFVSIDVSSAIRAAFIRQGEISPSNLSYEPLSVEWYAIEKKLVEGEFNSRKIATGIIEDIHRGGRSEVARYTDVPFPSRIFSNKPYGEIIGKDDKFILPNEYESVIYESSQLPESVNVCVDPNARGMCFAFVNSYGLLESASARTLELKSYGIKATQYNMVGKVSMLPQPHYSAVKSGGFAEWSASSGYTTRDWVEWWSTEFAMSANHWLLVQGKWIPVVVTPEETSTIYDRTKGELHSVNFSVKSTLQGKL